MTITIRGDPKRAPVDEAFERAYIPGTMAMKLSAYQITSNAIRSYLDATNCSATEHAYQCARELLHELVVESCVLQIDRRGRELRRTSQASGALYLLVMPAVPPARPFPQVAWVGREPPEQHQQVAARDTEETLPWHRARM